MSIFQPFAFRGVDQRRHPVAIAHLAVLPPEAEFVAVATHVTLAQVVENAERAEMPLSAWIRERLDRCAKRELKK